MLVLKKIKKDSTASYANSDFTYPEVGEMVYATKWEVEEEPKCNNIGLYGLPNGNGHWDLLAGGLWVVIGCDDKDVVCFGRKCKFKQGRIIYKSEEPPVEYIDRLATNSEGAYFWARDIGNKDIMIDRITESRWAYRWVRNIGNENIMADRITEAEWARHWMDIIGYNKIISQKISRNSLTNGKDML